MATEKRTTRRSFLKTASALMVPAIVPASALGRDNRPAPSERVIVGCIGLGGQGDRDMMGLLGDERVQVVALCDCDRGSTHYERGWHRGLAPARAKVEQRYAADKRAGTHKGLFTTGDFRELLARADIDAVTCSTPDHWHAAIVVAAARAGKDIYCQKPMSLTIADGRAMVEAVQRYNRVFQCGSQRRSDSRCRHACELVRPVPRRHAGARRAGLSDVAGPGPIRPLHAGSLSLDLPLEPGLLRRPAHRLGRPLHRHGPLGPWVRS